MNLILPQIIKRPVFRRWLDILLLAAFGIIVFFIFQQPLINFFNWIDEYSNSWPSFLFFSLISALIAGMTLLVVRLGGLHRNHNLRLILKYPPTYVAALIAIIGIEAILVFNDRNTDFGWILFYTIPFTFISIGFGVLLGFIVEWLGSADCALPLHSKPNRQGATRIRSIWDNEEEFLLWIIEESPIHHPDEDLFGHAIPARRISRLLLQYKPSSVGILGPYGSGKSSLLNLIEHYLKNQALLYTNSTETGTLFEGQIVFCRINGWGRASGSVALKILGLAIESVRSHVDCMSILSVPENYQKAIAGVKSGGGAILSALLGISHDPIIQLIKLDEILAATGFRLIIFLEDLDRNICDEIIRDEMPALLDRLRLLNCVSFILAIGTERQFSDILVRICDHVEAIA